MEKEKLFTSGEVAMRVQISIHTLEIWYRWKHLHPEHPLAKFVPDYIQYGRHTKRYWTKDDISKLQMFKRRLPRGRAGLFGEFTNTNYRNKKRKEKTNETSETVE